MSEESKKMEVLSLHLFLKLFLNSFCIWVAFPQTVSSLCKNLPGGEKELWNCRVRSRIKQHFSW